jgi:hypothetical protein
VVFKIDFWGGDLCAIVALLDDLYLMAPWSWNLARERGYHKKKKKKKATPLQDTCCSEMPESPCPPDRIFVYKKSGLS